MSVSKSSEKAKKAKHKLQGRKAPFSKESLDLIRASLKAQHRRRDLVLLNTAVDTLLRCGDLLSLRVRDVRDHAGAIVERLDVAQEKTSKRVAVTLTPRTREGLAEWVAQSGKWAEDFLFTPADLPHARHISEGMLRRLVKEWAALAHLDPAKHSGHSLRRTKATFIYKETRNAEAVRNLLGHTTMAHTIAYLGVTDDEVSDIAKRFDI